MAHNQDMFGTCIISSIYTHGCISARANSKTWPIVNSNPSGFFMICKNKTKSEWECKIKTVILKKEKEKKKWYFTTKIIFV